MTRAWAAATTRPSFRICRSTQRFEVIPEQVYPELPQAPDPAYNGSDEDFWGSVGTESEKTRRWRRTRADHPVDEAEQPRVVILPDVSVEPPLQVIPDVDGLQTLTEQPPNYGDGGNFWSSVGTEPEQAPRPWWRRRTTYAIATVLVTVVAVVVSLIAFSGPQVKNKRIAYTFPVEAFPQTGVTVSRTWTLYGGQHPSLHGDLTFYSSRSDQVTVEEILPSSLVSQASQVTFIPKPTIVSQNPVVASYSISSALDGVTSAEYTIPLPATTPYTLAVLHKWAAEQSADSGPALPAVAHAGEHPPHAGVDRRQEGRRCLPAGDQRSAAGRHPRSDHRVRYGQVVGRQPEDREGQ